MITDIAELRRRAFANDTNGHLDQLWRSRYHDAIRRDRVSALLRFCDYAARMARRHETNGEGWYGQHVRWAIHRLTLLGYTFPECDEIRLHATAKIIEQAVAA